MKYTGKYSMHENISNNPSKPFVDDLLKDLKSLMSITVKSNQNLLKRND